MALPTTLDNLNATMYALDRIKKERCLAAVRTTPGLVYQPDDTKRMYPCPSNVPECQHGRCTITAKDLCESKSQIPFNLQTGLPIEGRPCSNKDECNTGQICTHGKCVDAKPYLEFHDGKCVYGNFVLRKWCQYPSQRRTEATPGVTNVPPFAYNTENGKCVITKPYCDWMQTSFTTDDKGRPTCYSTTGQKIGEFFLGKTLFRGIKRATKISENFGGEGVSLYLHKERLGFVEPEIRKVYPEIIDGAGNLSFSLQDLKVPGKKRIYYISKNTGWISPSIVKALGRGVKK